MAFPQASTTSVQARSLSRPAGSPQCRTNPAVQAGGTLGEHKLEKLEFALAVALTRGDQQRSDDLRRQIDELGGNCEEPGT